MESSRVFIRGLPSNMSTEEFQKHFSKLSTTTDAKYIPRRRIGYVGYKTHKDALDAVKYFNKSFIHMSRIQVELARPVELAQKTQPPSFEVQNLDATQELKDSDHQIKASNPKLQEFLEVMQPPSKSKTWANEDSAGIEANTALLATKASSDAEDVPSDNGYQHLPRKRKRSLDGSEKPEKTDKTTKSKNDHEASREMSAPRMSVPKDSVASTDLPVVIPPEENQETPAASDVDWLRSRTSRLLGLLDGDDDANATGNPQPTRIDYDKTQRVLSDTLTTSKMSDVGSQADEKRAEVEIETIKIPEITKQGVIDTSRLFVRNLSYTTTEDDLRARFNSFGDLEEIHLPVDPRSGATKGFAYVQYRDVESATHALQELDGKTFQGRLLHIIPAIARKDNTLDDYAILKLPIKKQKLIKQKAEAASATFKWNSLYMNADAIMSSISNRLGISKSELIDPTLSHSAVKQAHAETNIIQETKAYFTANNVDLVAFKNKERGDTAILVKNFSYGTTIEDLGKLFETYGSITKLLMPPSGTIAIIEFEQASQAKSAFGALAYRKFKDSILFLEKAPRNLFTSTGSPTQIQAGGATQNVRPSATELIENTSAENSVDTSVLFVKNLNFITTTRRLREVFLPLDGFMSARVKTKPDPKKLGEVLSMGFGFLEFHSKEQAQAALAAMNGFKLDGHDLVIKASHRALNAAEERKKDDQAKKIAGRRTKIIVKNLPFEASKQDVRSLFGAYGQLRSVRVPKKFDNSTRGFAFANFLTAREAENAMEALRDTHLLGRRLALDFAAEDTVDPEEEIEKMQKKVGKQADKIALQRLTGVGGRKKFNVQGGEVVDIS